MTLDPLNKRIDTLLAAAVIPALYIAEAYAIAWIWKTHVATLGAPLITAGQAAGMMALFNLVKFKSRREDKEPTRSYCARLCDNAMAIGLATLIAWVAS